jgi:hypothetical protein
MVRRLDGFWLLQRSMTDKPLKRPRDPAQLAKLMIEYRERGS